MRIDRAGVVRVLGLLTGDRATAARGRSESARAAVSAAGAVAAKGRSLDNLRARLRVRLTRLKHESSDYERQAPEVAVREVLAWQFGEEVTAHPAFGRVAREVAGAIDPAGRIGGQFAKLLAELRVG